MILQSTIYTCGPSAIVNALSSLGADHPEVTESIVAKLAGASPIAGTNVTGMRRALSALRFRPRALSYGQPKRAVSGLLRALRAGHPCALLVDEDEHWVAAVGHLGDRVLIADSASGHLVESWSIETLIRRWSNGRPKPGYYGIEIVP